MTFDAAMAEFRAANEARHTFRRSADAFAFEENQIAMELARDHERDQRRRANLANEEPPCSSA